MTRMVSIRCISLGSGKDRSHFGRQGPRLPRLTINTNGDYVTFGQERPVDDAENLELHADRFLAFESGTEADKNGIFSGDGFHEPGERLNPGHQNVQLSIELHTFSAVGSEELGFGILCETKEMGEEDLSGGVGIVPIGLQSSLKHLISPQRDV